MNRRLWLKNAYEISILYEWLYIFNLCTLTYTSGPKLSPTLYYWIFKLGRAGRSLHWQQSKLYLPIIIKGSASGDYLAIAHPPTRANCPLHNWTRHIVPEQQQPCTMPVACGVRDWLLPTKSRKQNLKDNSSSRLHTNRLLNHQPHTPSHYNRQTGAPRRVAHSSRWGQAHRRSLDRNYIASL